MKIKHGCTLEYISYIWLYIGHSSISLTVAYMCSIICHSTCLHAYSNSPHPRLHAKPYYNWAYTYYLYMKWNSNRAEKKSTWIVAMPCPPCTHFEGQFVCSWSAYKPTKHTIEINRALLLKVLVSRVSTHTTLDFSQVHCCTIIS